MKTPKLKLGYFVFIPLTALICTSVILKSSAPVYASEAGQVYRKPLPSLPVTFDPKFYSDAYSVIVSTQIYDRLFEFDDFQNIKPSLAEKWETAEGGKIWTIYLKNNVKFHNGKTLTARDVEFMLYRLLEPDSSKSQELSIIAGSDEYIKKKSKTVSGIKALSPEAIRIELKSPFPPFLSLFTAMNTETIPWDYNGETESNFFKHPIGTGPYKFESYEPDQRVTLVANEQYFLGRPLLDKIIFEKSTTENAIKGFNNGYYQDLEWYSDLDPRRLTNTYTMIKAPVAGLNVIAINNRRPPFNNVHFRKALMYALDRVKLAEECFPGRKVAAGFVPPGVGGYYPEMPKVLFDLNKAKEELKLSKLSRKEISKMITFLRPDNHLCIEKFGPFVEGSYKKIGLNVTVRHLPFNEIYDKYYMPRNFEMLGLNFYADHPEGLFMLHAFQSDNPDNYSGIKSRAVDELLLKAGSTEDRYERFKLYRKAQEILQQDAVVIPLVYNIYENIYQRNVLGVERSPYSTYIIPMRKIHFDSNSTSLSH